MAPLWIFALTLLCGAGTAERHYIFTAPKSSRAGENERMCITLFDTPETGLMTVTLKKRYGDNILATHTQEVNGVSGGSKQTCFDVTIPEDHVYSAILSLGVDFYPAEANYSIRGERDVNINSWNPLRDQLFVQTDKYVYKPGQTVRFRVFHVDSDLRPFTEPFPLVYVESPLGTRVAQWRDVVTQNGLTQMDFQLSDDPTLGVWKIHVKTSGDSKEEKDFEVQEYVLPKFEVTVKGKTSYVLGDAKEVVWYVCGRYTYGKPVQGEATIKVSFSDRRSRPDSTEVTLKSQTKGDDCAEFRVSTDRLVDGEFATIRPYSFRVSANLTEEGTGVTLSGSNTFFVEYTTLKLKTNKNDKYFKPGLPFNDQISVNYPDDRPAPGKLVEICYKTVRTSDTSSVSKRSIIPHFPPDFDSSSRLPEDKICQNLTSDSAGIVRFIVPPQDENVEKISVEVTSPLEPHREREGMQSERLSIKIKGWHSASGAYLQLGRADGEMFRCGAIASLPVFFTHSSPGGEAREREVFFQVMGRGDILQSESVRATFEPTADLTSLEGGAYIGEPSGKVGSVGVTTLSIPVTPSMSSGFKVLVYLIVEGEVIADSQQYEAVACLENQVSLAWRPDRARPRESVGLAVSAAPGSICGIDVVDKSVTVLSSKNRISLADFFNNLKRLNLERWAGTSQIDDNKYCTNKYGEPKLPSVEPPSPEFDIPRDLVKAEPAGPPGIIGPISPPRWREHTYAVWKTKFADSLTAFDHQAFLLLSDLTTETRECVAKRRTFYPVYYSDSVLRGADASSFGGTLGPPGPPRLPGSVVSDPVPTASREKARPSPPSPAPSAVPEVVRTYLPETWLFDLHAVGEDGTVTLSEQVPDTITEWVAGAVCTSPSAGLGIAESASLTSFQPFFVSYTLPYSVKRGETLILKVSVFNYNQHDLPVKVTLVDSDEFETLTTAVLTSCVPSGAAEVVPFRLRPSALGDVNITVVAEVYPDFPSACGPATLLHFSDAVKRPILVEPEGFEREEAHSSFICLGPESGESDLDVTWPLSLPADLVPGSERAYVSVVGDLLGPSIDNLESLVRKPTGCGEQNMVKFAPNIHVMKYLIANGELTEELKDKLTSHMKTGYQRELKYRHGDNSFSAFGKSDDSGSMWLTSFVVRCFGDAKKYIFIDEDDLNGSVDWIESKQKTNGCFPSVGLVLHKAMKGGVASGGEKGLTAFVTIALLKSGVKLKTDTISNAFRCLDDGSDADVYTLTLKTYAQALHGLTNEAKVGLNTLRARAKREAGYVYWQQSETRQNLALSVEMGAYNVLTMELLKKQGYEVSQLFSEQLGAIRWMNSQRKSTGGFVSTQDTVLALEAMAAFSAALSRNRDSNLQVRVSDGYGLNDVVSVTPLNRLLMQRRDVTHLPGQVHVTAEGSGCALVQTILKYNVKTAEPNDALTIRVNAKPKQNQKECLKHTIDVCVSYLQEDGETNMAVVELEMVSGFIPNKGSLKELEQDKALGLKRWEVANNKVAFYFDSLDASDRCMAITVQRELEVEDAKAAIVKVYDYYEAEFAISTSYSLDVDCRDTPVWLWREADPFDGFAVVDDDLALPGGEEGVAPRIAAPPLGFRSELDVAADQEMEKEADEGEDYLGLQCPVCLDSLRKADFQYYLCGDERVMVASLEETGAVTYHSVWRMKGKPKRLGTRQNIVVPDGCDCILDTGRPLYVFGVTRDQLKQPLLLLTDQHVLAAAPATAQLRRRQVELARKRGCP